MDAKGGHKKKSFTDEKIVTIEQYFDNQKNRVCTESSKEANQLVKRVKLGTIRL